MNKSLNLPRLTDALIRAGMNQSDLAARLKVSREAVSNWMRGESFPQPAKLLRIGMLLGLKFDELVQTPPPAAKSIRIVEPRRNGKKVASRVAETPARGGDFGAARHGAARRAAQGGDFGGETAPQPPDRASGTN